MPKKQKRKISQREIELRKNKKRAQARRRVRINRLEFIEFAKAIGEKDLFVKRKGRDGKISFVNILTKQESINLQYQISAHNKIIDTINRELKIQTKKYKPENLKELQEFEQYEFFIYQKSNAEDLINNSENQNVDELSIKLHELFYELSGDKEGNYDKIVIYIDSKNYIQNISLVKNKPTDEKKKTKKKSKKKKK